MFTGSIWNAMAATSRQIPPTTPGTMVPGWNSSSITPIMPMVKIR